MHTSNSYRCNEYEGAYAYACRGGGLRCYGCMSLNLPVVRSYYFLK